MNCKIKLWLAFMKMHFSSESFYTELTADKVLLHLKDVSTEHNQSNVCE